MSKYINEKRLIEDALKIPRDDLREKIEELLGKLIILKMKIDSDCATYEEKIRFCDALLQMTALKECRDELNRRH